MSAPAVYDNDSKMGYGYTPDKSAQHAQAQYQSGIPQYPPQQPPQYPPYDPSLATQYPQSTAQYPHSASQFPSSAAPYPTSAQNPPPPATWDPVQQANPTKWQDPALNPALGANAGSTAQPTVDELWSRPPTAVPIITPEEIARLPVIQWKKRLGDDIESWDSQLNDREQGLGKGLSNAKPRSSMTGSDTRFLRRPSTA